MRIFSLAAMAALCMLLLVPARADVATQEDFRCSFVQSAEEVSSVKQLPAAILAALPQPTADRGEAFNASDVISPNTPPQARLIRAGHWNTQWFVWLERGGRGSYREIWMFDTPGATPVPMLKRIGTQDLCTQTEDLRPLVTGAKNNPGCAFKHDVAEVVSVRDLPTNLAIYLPHPMADRGEIGGGDVNPDPLLFRAGHVGNLWFVWYTTGTIRYLQFYDISSGVVEVKPPATKVSGDFCAGIDAVLDAMKVQ